MKQQSIEALAGDVWRIDTAYVDEGVAACFLLKGGYDYALIECGSGVSVKPILSALDQLHVAREQIKYLIPTHVHLDHAGGVGGLLAELPQAQVYAHPRGARHLVDPSRLIAGATAVYGEEAFARQNGEILAVPAARCHEAGDGCRLDLGGRPLEIRDAPGHAKHHLVVWDKQTQGFFTGDVFGLCYPKLNIQNEPYIVPTTTPVQFDPVAWQNTLDMMRGHSPKTMYMTHYGAVAATDRLFDELQAGVDSYAQMALDQAHLGEEGLAEHIMQYEYSRYQSQGGALGQSEFEAVLGMDTQLSAQGLVFWVENIKQ